jgi:hypothetical protein
MISPLVIDLFAEDRAHEELLGPLIERLARENGRQAYVHVRSARGGHGRVIQELDLYQKSIASGVAATMAANKLVPHMRTVRRDRYHRKTLLVVLPALLGRPTATWWCAIRDISPVDSALKSGGPC